VRVTPIYLYIVPFFPSPQSWRGGFFFDAVKALMRDGRYDVRVVVGNGGHDYEIDGIRVYGFRRFKVGDSDYFEALTDWIKIRQFAAKLHEMGLDSSDIAVCHVHLLERYAFYAAWMKNQNPKCLTLVHHHWTGMGELGYNKFPWVPFVKEIQYVRLRNSYERVDANIFCSEACREGFGLVYVDGFLGKRSELRSQLFFPKLFRPMSYASANVVYNGIDGTVFCLTAKAPSESFRIGCVANFIKQKAQMTLIQAFEKVYPQMPNAKLIFVGSGAEKRACEQYVKEHGLLGVVEFLAELSHLKIPDFYRSLDLYVMPSYWEAFNCSLIEAWACGVPCMTTEEISFKEVLNEDDFSRWLFPAKDIEALGQRLLEAYTTRPVRQKLARDLDIAVTTRSFLDWVDTMRAGEK